MTPQEKASAYDKAIEKAAYLLSLIPCKPSEWSEEDTNMFGSVLSTLGICSNNPTIPAPVREIHKKEERWFSDLYNRLCPQKWSEEDESKMNNLCHFLEEYGNQYYGHLTLQGTISWLKSLKPQSMWKPGDEQMVVLNDIIINGHLSNANERILKSLQEQLKKLMEE